MKVYLGNKGLEKSHQEPFEETVDCRDCGSESRVMFVVFEDGKEKKGVARVRDNGGEGNYWPHDACAVACYLCKECFETTSVMNQA
jgi:hypothetical protein